MRPANLKKFVKNVRLDTDTNVKRKVFSNIVEAFEKSKAREETLNELNIWRIIMKSKIAKIAAAAVITAAVLIAIHYTGGSIDGSGVVWADVVKKIENSRGNIYRFIISDSPGYSKFYLSPENFRLDTYENEELVSSTYKDFKSKTIIYVHHNTKSYVSRRSQENSEVLEDRQDSMMDPLFMLKAILSYEHRELGQKNIDAVLCEGIETNDLNALIMMNPEDQSLFANMKNSEFRMRLWINKETQYPVRAEYKLNAEFNGKIIEGEAVLDQFQWDVNFDPNFFEPNIPSDYQSMELPVMN
jgi:hypothetical protein